MNFTDLVTRKIEERRAGFIEALEAAADADMRLKRRLEPLRQAVFAMLDELALDPLFAVAMGKPEVVVTRVADDDRGGDLQLKGWAGTLSFNVYGHAVYGNCLVGIRIDPAPSVVASLRRASSYGDGAEPCDLAKVPQLIARARSHLGDFLADLCLNSAIPRTESPSPANP